MIETRSRILIPFILILLFPAAAHAQAVIKVNDNVSFRFGTLVQAWADAQQDATTRGYAQNLFLRRIRLLVGGQIAPNVTFFFDTDNPNLGKAPKALGGGFITQDAWLEWKPSNRFMIDAGLMFIPLCRNCIQSGATHLTLDYGSFSFLHTAPTQGSVGRDTGIQAKGYLAANRLEYRIGAFQGFRGPGARNPLRVSGRLMYNFWDPEVVPFFYNGTYLGSKRVLAVGSGFDKQDDYQAYAADFFLERPLANGHSITSQVNWIHYDGGSMFASLPEQDDVLAELGYYIKDAKLLPFVRFESQDFEAGNSRDNRRYQAGLTWYPNGHNFNIRGAYSRVDPKAGEATNQFTVQFQLFYY